MKKALNMALLTSFILTVLVPLTGVHLHKLASVAFLLLSVVHTVVYRKKLGSRKFLQLALVIAAFASGLFGLILEAYPLVLTLHRVISIAVVFFLAIHIFLCHKRF